MPGATLTDRVFNFSAGPANLPLSVLEHAQRELLALPGVGASILEISHRSPAFLEILESAKQRLTDLLAIPENYQVVFLQGGSRLQFSMVPMNLLRGSTTPADFLLTGSWSKKALVEAEKEGPVNIAWDGKDGNYDRLPETAELELTPGAPYAYFTSNETIQGVQFPREPDTGNVPLVCDASSDFLSRPLAIEKYGLIYACAQKNAGPAGVTVVIVREDLLQRAPDSLPGYLDYRGHIAENSLYNTPPTFAIYILDLVARWLQEEIGGLENMHQRNSQKAQLLYDVIDQSGGFYRGHAQPASRSLMNVIFRLADDGLENEFLSEAARNGLCELKGHRSVGGIRASIYNAMPVEGVESLRDFMQQFHQQH